MKKETRAKKALEFWNKNVACNMPSKKQIRARKKEIQRTRRELDRDFDEYVDIVLSQTRSIR